MKAEIVFFVLVFAMLLLLGCGADKTPEPGEEVVVKN